MVITAIRQLRRDLKAALKLWDDEQIIGFYPLIRESPPNSILIRNSQGKRFIITIVEVNHETS
jgi:hypothetical protein